MGLLHQWDPSAFCRIERGRLEGIPLAKLKRKASRLRSLLRGLDAELKPAEKKYQALVGYRQRVLAMISEVENHVEPKPAAESQSAPSESLAVVDEPERVSRITLA